MAISDRLQSLMKRRGIKSQSQLARISGVPQSSIHRILARGDAYSPERPTLRKLAMALNTSVPWLADGIEVVEGRNPASARQHPPVLDSPPAGGHIIEAVAILAELEPEDRRKIVAVLRLLQQRAGVRRVRDSSKP